MLIFSLVRYTHTAIEYVVSYICCTLILVVEESQELVQQQGDNDEMFKRNYLCDNRLIKIAESVTRKVLIVSGTLFRSIYL